MDHHEHPTAFSIVLDDMERTLLAEIFSIFADPSRIQIITTLLGGEMSVTELQTAVGLSQSATSHQLKLLKSARVVKAKRVGRNILYSLDDQHISSILIQGLNHVRKVDCEHEHQ